MTDNAHDDVRGRLLTNLDELFGLVQPQDEQWANWLRGCRALIARDDVRGLDRFLEGVTESGGLADIDLAEHAQRVAELIADCHDDATALRHPG
jgi:hypothetical protein